MIASGQDLHVAVGHMRQSGDLLTSPVSCRRSASATCQVSLLLVETLLSVCVRAAGLQC